MTPEDRAGVADALPADDRLPLVGALTRSGARAVLGRHGLEPAGALRVLGHHPGSRMALGDDDGLIVKAYAEHPVAMIDLLRSLKRAGLTGPEPPLATPVLAHDPDLRMVVTPRLPGPSARELVMAGQPERAARLAAAWLRAVAEAPVAQGPDRGPAWVTAEATTWASELADEGLRPRAERVARLLAGASPAETPRVLLHTSYRPRHVIALEGGPGVYDWDGFGQGRIELDVATFLVVMERAAKGVPDRLAAAERAAAVLLDEVSGLADRRAVEWHRAAMLVKHAWRLGRAQSTRWRPRAGALLDRALTACRDAA